MSTDPTFDENALRADYARHDQILTTAVFSPYPAASRTWRARATEIERKWIESPHSEHWGYLEYIDAVCDDDLAAGRTTEVDPGATEVQRRSFEQARDLVSHRATMQIAYRYDELDAAAQQAWNDYQASNAETRDSTAVAEQDSAPHTEPADQDRRGSGTSAPASEGHSAVGHYQPGHALADAVARDERERDEVER